MGSDQHSHASTAHQNYANGYLLNLASSAQGNKFGIVRRLELTAVAVNL